MYLKHTLNGIFNTLVGCMIIYLLNSYSLLSAQTCKLRYSTLIYNVIMIFVLLPLLGFVVYEGKNEFETFQKKSIAALQTVNDEVTQNVSLFFNYQMTSIVELANHLSSKNIEINDLQKELDLISKVSPNIVKVYVVDQDGKTIAFAPSVNEGENTLGLDFSEREYFHLVKQEKKPVVSDVFVGCGEVYEPIVTFNSPIIKEGEFSGFVCGLVNLDSITQILRAKARNDVNITILDSKQQIIVTTDPMLKPLDQHNILLNYNKSYIEKNLYYLSLQKHADCKMSSYDNSYYVYINDKFLKNIERTLIIQMPISSALQSLYEEISNALLLALFILLTVIVIGHLTSRSMVQSLLEITRVAEELPEKITNKSFGIWPKSKINEVSILVNTFQLVEQKLHESFSETKRNEEKFKYLAHHDSLTGLPNKLQFIKKVSTELRASGDMKAVMFVDLDGFKVVNDTLGHSEGDNLLIQVADRLRKLLRGDDFLARQGGDEFLLYTSIKEVEEVRIKANELLKEVSQPYYLGDSIFYLTATIGISIFPLHGGTLEILLKNADIAMYAGKSGKNCFYLFEQKLLADIESKIKMEKKLRDALEKREFDIHYQPVFDIRSNKLIGAEALIRWQDNETKRLIPPLEFIPLAEETGFIIPLGEWILKTATRQAVEWMRQTDLPLSIAVNISARQFLDGNFVRIVSEALDESGLNPENLTLEITETNVMEHLELALAKMKELKTIGIKFALDDFGTGYSSLSYLKQFPLDTLKIDKSFISDLVINKQNVSLVSAVVDVAHTFNLNVVAEGVELNEQLQLLSKLKCDLAQGYLLAKPLTTQDFIQRLFTEVMGLKVKP